MRSTRSNIDHANHTERAGVLDRFDPIATVKVPGSTHSEKYISLTGISSTARSGADLAPVSLRVDRCPE